MQRLIDPIALQIARVIEQVNMREGWRLLHGDEEISSSIYRWQFRKLQCGNVAAINGGNPGNGLEVSPAIHRAD